jgi:hypothetical protein
MPITFPKPSDNVMDIVNAGTNLSRSVIPMGKQDLTDDNIPQRVYTIGLEEIAAGAGLEQAKMCGWRVFHHEDSGASVEIYSDDSETKYEFGGINRGPFVQGLRNALQEVSSHARFKEQEYELNILKIPALYIMSFWMRHQNSKEDVIIPIAPTHPRLEPNREYSPEEFFADLQDDAKTRLAFDDSPTG